MGSKTWSQLEARIRFLFRELSTEIANRDWRAPPRPWSDFFERFSIPKKDANSVANRAILNSHIYQTNYCIILGAALLYYILFRPTSLFVVGCIIVAWVYATSPKPIVIKGRRITRRERFLSVSILSLFTLIVSGILLSFTRTLGVAIFFILLHASLRHTGIRSKVGEIRTHMADRW